MLDVTPHQLCIPVNTQAGFRITFMVGKKEKRKGKVCPDIHRFCPGGHDPAPMLLMGYLEETNGGAISPGLQLPNRGSLKGNLCPVTQYHTLSYWTLF